AKMRFRHHFALLLTSKVIAIRVPNGNPPGMSRPHATWKGGASRHTFQSDKLDSRCAISIALIAKMQQPFTGRVIDEGHMVSQMQEDSLGSRWRLGQLAVDMQQVERDERTLEIDMMLIVGRFAVSDRVRQRA